MLNTMQALGRKDVAKILRVDRTEVLLKWENEVRSHVPAAEQQNEFALMDSLPKFYDEMVELLECKDPDCKTEVASEVAREHGKDRFEMKEYSLDEMISEYHIFRAVLKENLDSHGTYDRETRKILDTFVDDGVRKAVDEYVEREKEKDAQKSESSRKTLASAITVLEKEREQREQFVAALTHDLRTPLTSAKIAAQLIERKPEQLILVQTMAKKVVRSMDRADQMIRDILDASRIKAGEGIVVTITPVELGHLVDHVASELSEIYGPRFRTLKPSAPVNGFWDMQGMQRIIENLASNAIKYGKSGSPVTLSVVKNNDGVELKVHNEGNPIAASDYERIFDAYQRAHSSRSLEVGWGVGLTLVKAIAEAQGGTVGLESSAKSGTTFFVKLPLDARTKK